MHDLGMYLGMPLIPSRITGQTFAYVVDRARSKLHRWKAKTLSRASRLLLIQSTLIAILTCSMQTTESRQLL